MSETGERQPLLGTSSGNPANAEQHDDLERGDRHSITTHGENDETREGSYSSLSSCREWTAEKLEAPSTHKTVVLLIAIDACSVLADLVYTFLSPERECPTVNISSLSSLLASSSPSFPTPSTPAPPTLSQLTNLEPRDEPTWLTTTSHISLTINTLFLLEIPLALWCFGPAYYNPLPNSLSGDEEKHPYAGLHLFDALVVITTFVLEVVLRGREAEVAGLLVLLRLWRLVKLVSGLAVGAGELQEELSNQLSETQQLLSEARIRASQLEQHNASLRLYVARLEPTTPTSPISYARAASVGSGSFYSAADKAVQTERATATGDENDGPAVASGSRVRAATAATAGDDIEVERWVLVLSEAEANGN